MDWTWVHTVAIVLLNSLVLWIWKPWANAYAGEKGKNLARKEDLDEILAEVRAVTITQREIEAKISGELWDRQMRWNQKRDVYVAILKHAIELRDALTSRGLAMRLNMPDQVSQRHTEFMKAIQGLSKLAALAGIFTNPECGEALSECVSGLSSLPGEVGSTEWDGAAALTLNRLVSRTVSTAKVDLGLG